MDLNLPICNAYRKTERGYCSLTCWEQKHLSILQNDSPVAHNNSFKMMPFHNKTPLFGGLEHPEISVLATESLLLVA